MRRLFVGLFAGLIAAALGTGALPVAASGSSQTIVGIAVSNPDFSTLVAAVSCSGLVPALNGRAKPDHSRRNRRIFMIADLLLRLALRLIQPKNLAKYSGSREKNAYISVSNSIMGSNWLNRWLERSPSVAAIFLLHDVIPITNPEFTYPTTTVRHRRYVTRLTKSANTIIANSKFTYECLKEFAFAEDLRLPEVEVAPLGVDDCFVTGGALAPSKTPYFVFIATIEPRKNHIMLLQVWQRLVAKLGPACPKLLLIGRRGWENENALDLLERSVMLRKYVLECSNVPDQLLVKILVGARAALFPSHVEGYGLPLSEALSVGVPVICSDLPPFREIADGIPEYADPLAGRGWLKLIMEYSAVDNPKRAAQIDRIKQYKPHRWSDHLAVLDEVLANVGAADGPGAPPITAAIGNDDLEPPPGPPKLTFVADKRG